MKSSAVIASLQLLFRACTRQSLLRMRSKLRYP